MRDNVLELLRTNRRLGRPAEIHISLRIDRPYREVIAMPGFQEVLTLADSVEFNRYFDSWSGRIKQEDLTGTMKIRSKKLHVLKGRIPCSSLYFGIGVLVDGTVTACACRDLEGKSDLVLGNINTTSLREMWHSAKLKQLRNNWKRFGNVPDICSDCSHYNPYTYMMLNEVKMKTQV
jgi:radical SAM protein with 4Fe4S-binding SPASM domain